MTIYLRGKFYDLTDDEIEYLKAVFQEPAFIKEWDKNVKDAYQKLSDKVILGVLTQRICRRCDCKIDRDGLCGCEEIKL